MEEHWSAETANGNWAIRYHPMPGGKKNADGSVSYSLSFPALTLTDWVSEPAKVAADIAAALNRDELLDDLVQALAGYVVLGVGKCSIGKPQADLALAVLERARSEKEPG